MLDMTITFDAKSFERGVTYNLIAATDVRVCVESGDEGGGGRASSREDDELGRRRHMSYSVGRAVLGVSCKFLEALELRVFSNRGSSHMIC